MKKYLKLPLIMIPLILAVIVFQSGIISAIHYDVKVIVNGKYVDYSGGYGQPFLTDEGRTLVPVRGTAEAYGCTVEWDGPNYRAVVTYGEHYAIIPINDMYIDTDAGIVYLDTYARIIDDRTYLPIRAVMEAMGAQVDWIAASRTVVIKEPGTIYDDPMAIDDDGSLALLKNSLSAKGTYNNTLEGYVYQEAVPANSTLTSKLVYCPGLDLVYVLIEMDLDGNSGNSYTELKLYVNGSNNRLGTYSFEMVNTDAVLNWSGSFEKSNYSNPDSFVMDQTSDSAKNIRSSMLLNDLTVYQTGLAVQAIDSYCGKYYPGIMAIDLGFDA